MYYFDTHKDSFIRLLLWLLMLLSLAASMRHVAWLFSTIEMMDTAAGWIAAVGFDFGIFLLTLLAHKYKEGSTQRRFIRAGIYANAVLSAIANIMYGVEHQVELERIQGWLWLLIPYVFALALPMMVVFFAEVLSREEENESRAFERGQKKRSQAAKELLADQATITGSDATNEAHKLDRDSRKELVVQAIENGRYSHRAIAAYSGISRGSISNLLGELKAENRLIIAGNGRLAVPTHSRF